MTKTTIDLAPAADFLAFHTRKGYHLLCAVSGGLDSMCLLHFVSRWAGENGRTVTAAHFNHRLRENASKDEAFVRSWCAGRGIPFVSGSGDVRGAAEGEGLSVEEAARNLRYAFLRETADRLDCKAILTAHHADDNAETMLMNLVRGTGIKGLCGIPDRQGNVLRPFLQIPRETLERYAAEQNLPHVEDETNRDPEAAVRNRIRLQVMPLLKEMNPRAAEHMGSTARQLYTVDRSLDEDALHRTAHMEVQDGRVPLSWETLTEAPWSVRPRMLLRMFDLLGVGRKDIGAVHLDAILDMPRHTGSKESCLSLPHGVTARSSRGWLILETRPQTLTDVELLPGKPLRWGDYTLTWLDRCEGEGITLRTRFQTERPHITVGPCPPGERLTLPGSNGSRSVKRLCMDRKISLSERDGLPAIYADGTLAAVWQLGTDVNFLPEGTEIGFIQVLKQTEERDYEK